MYSCTSSSNYTKACSSAPNPQYASGQVSGKEIKTKRVKSNSYRNARRPVKLGLLRK